MRKMLLGIALTAACLVLATPAVADEYDFVGYRYSQDYNRDYDRGFFFGAEAWFVNSRDLHFDPVFAGDGLSVGGRLLDVDFDHDASGRYYIGYRANRRVGTFTLSYWDYSEDAFREEIGNGIFSATNIHPLRAGTVNPITGLPSGDVTSDSFQAQVLVDMEYAELEWSKDFGQGRKFTGTWSAALNWWELEYETASLHFNEAAPSNAVLLENFTSTKSFGVKFGVGGRYHFNDRMSFGMSGAIGWASSEYDALFTDQNLPSGQFVAAIERDHTESSAMQFEGDFNFHLRVAGGLEIDWGYRYLSFEDAVARDAFVDNNGKFVTVEQPRDLSFEGPYVSFTYVTGVAKIDGDGDTVLDVYDDCPDTPTGAWVDEKGCPKDTDDDGVYDGTDRCPGTRFGTRVDEYGCGVDSDGDGVFDGLDLCPNTPGCAHVDARGCPKDTDGDGVANGCDACPGTASGTPVDSNGCASDLDADGDTVPDARDRCPNTMRGATVDEWGCETVVQMILHFDSNSSRIRGEDTALLDRIARALMGDGGAFEVAGHADSQNTVEYNQGLSERRAQAVVQYLVAKGVAAGNLTAVGYSELRPVAGNDTAEGRALNRRVEIVRR